MKRPLLVIGCTFLLVSAVAVYLGSTERVLFGSLGVLALCAVMKKKKLRKNGVLPLIMVTGLAAVLSVGVYTAMFIAPSEVMQGKTVLLTGELCELPYESSGRYYYELNAKELVAKDSTVLENTKVLVSSSEKLDIEPYDTLKAAVSINRTTPLYRTAKGILLTGYLTEPQEAAVIRSEQRPLYYCFLKLRQGITDRLFSLNTTSQAGFLSAFIVGEKTIVDQEVKEDLQDAGVSHIIVVSGLHLTILTHLCSGLMIRLLRRRRLSLALTALLVLFYMTLTGFSPAVVRAGVMQIIILIGQLIYREPQPLLSLSIAVFLMTLHDPYAAVDVGLLMSFFATLGILLLSDKISKALREKTVMTDSNTHFYRLRKCAAALLCGCSNIIGVTLSAILFVLPVTIIYFQRVPLYCVFTNLLISPVLPVLMAAALLMLVLSCCGILSFLAVPFAYLSGGIAEYIMAVAKQTAVMPFAVLQMSEWFVPLWLILVLAVCAFLVHLKKLRQRVGIALIFSILSLTGFMALTDIMNSDIVRIAVLDTGNGITVILPKNHEAAVLSCGGNIASWQKVRNYLRGTQIEKISFMLLGNSNYSISSYAELILKNYQTDTVLFFDGAKWNDRIGGYLRNVPNCIGVSDSQQPQKVIIGESTVLDVIMSYSCHAVFMDIHGYRVLICQDSTNAEKLPKEWKSGDLLILNGKLPYKGEWNYDTVVLSDNENNGITYRYWQENEECLSTFDGGNIVVRLSPDNQAEIRREERWLS